ncbi:hypothetical protein [Brachybacterium alimentarium]|uniref:hypothetical protein n=1 Tax=Brachybacterium alimentarium TaxID=47845 RepID=UPI0011C06DE5|nr:hypothetical protein [Brachybacterium alimentarium]
MIKQPLPVFYLGDSHVRYFKKAAKHGLLSPHELTGVEVGGATAVGMRNPNSKTNAIGRYRKWIGDKTRESIVILHLGEVDCGFVIWYRADKYGESIDSQMRLSIDAYFEFVDELIDLGFINIIVTGATLPTITDDDQMGEVVIKRSQISATQMERTELTLEYNRALRHGATQRGLPYIDVTPDVLDPETGVVDEIMRHPNPENHHMNGNFASAYWAPRLRTAISRYQAPAIDRREWTCIRDTFIKAYPGHSKSMPVRMRQEVRAGDSVTAEAWHQCGKFTVLRNARINGVEFPLLSHIHTTHFSTAV